jgi:hypothetical protein
MDIKKASQHKLRSFFYIVINLIGLKEFQVLF